MKDTANQPLTSCEKLEILGRKHAVSHFEKGNFLDSPNEEVQKWLDRNHVMTSNQEFDQAYDAYCKGFQSYHVEKWIAGLTVEEVADLRSRLYSLTPPVSTQTDSGASLDADRHSVPPSLFSRMEAALRASAMELDHFHRTGQPTKSFMQSETLILGLGDLVAELNRLPAPPSPEKPVVQPTGGITWEPCSKSA
jgi:hypothetical protein